ncbi:YwqG family protein [Bacillus sp. DX1.1]|uniref:YwqG family protein n=1 Tax=unclassified Bacillus (in: firmicutes) TaxID=185979 RepID=UPI00256FD5BD|nr:MULTISPECIES: YwqG family protein [unclassified Bacillus (in: firmicutes)]MDM5154540.1 YwqG family protein [Bacillus sp. DX1.1]WJE83436.1 YwqG family protein [Bacillus sp. DX3.1]
MKKQIESLIDKYELTHIKQELLSTIFTCVKVFPRQEDSLPIGCSKMGGVPDVPDAFQYPTYKGYPLDFIAQFNLADLQEVGMKHDLPATGMLYFFYFADQKHEDFHEVYGNPNRKEGWRVLHYDVQAEQLQRMSDIKGTYTQCAITFELTYKLPELFIEDEADSDRFLQLLEELSPDQYDNHQLFGEPFSVQAEVFEEAEEYIGVPHHDMTLLFQIDSDQPNCNMMWGDLGMLYFCIANEDLKHRRFENTCCLLQSC